LYARYALADRLGKTLEEINELTVNEFIGWVAYLNIVSEKMKNGK
jgi:hypothetical protein